MSRIDVGREVAVFTASGTFRGTRGRVLEVERSRVRVEIPSEPFPMFFDRGEIVPLDDGSGHFAGAE